MDQESREAARLLSSMARPGDTIFIRGLLAQLLIAYTRLPVGARVDSQPLTGVPADRHLTRDQSAAPSGRAETGRNSRTQPTWIADGLSQYNPALDIHNYPDLSVWLKQYCEVAKAGRITLYRLCSE